MKKSLLKKKKMKTYREPLMLFFFWLVYPFILSFFAFIIYMFFIRYEFELFIKAACIGEIIAGFSGSVLQQGLTDGFDNVDYMSAGASGLLSAACNIINFGCTNFVMRESVGLFESSFDKSLPYMQRVGESLSFSIGAAFSTAFFTIPFTVENILGEIFIYRSKNFSSNIATQKFDCLEK